MKINIAQLKQKQNQSRSCISPYAKLKIRKNIKFDPIFEGHIRCKASLAAKLAKNSIENFRSKCDLSFPLL